MADPQPWFSRANLMRGQNPNAPPVPQWPGGPQAPPSLPVPAQANGNGAAKPVIFDPSKVECFQEQSPDCYPSGVFYNPPGPSAPPVDPSSISKGILLALCGNPIVTTDQMPHYSPPFRAVWESDYVKAVINVPLGGDATAILGAAALATAEAFNLTGVTVQTFQQKNVQTPVTVLSATVPNYTNVTIKKFGVRVSSWGGLRALRWSIWINQGIVLSEQEVNFADPSQPMDMFALATQNDVISVMVRNLDPMSSFLIEPYLSGWRYPVDQSSDDQASTVARRGPGTSCGPGA